MTAWDPDVVMPPMTPDGFEVVRSLLHEGFHDFLWSDRLKPDGVDLGDHSFKYVVVRRGSWNVVVTGCVVCGCRSGRTDPRSNDGWVLFNVAIKVAQFVGHKFGLVCAEAAKLRVVMEVQSL